MIDVEFLQAVAKISHYFKSALFKKSFKVIPS